MFTKLKSFLCILVAFNLDMNDSTCFSKFLKQNFAHKNKIIQNLKKDLTIDKVFKRNKNQIYDQSLKTINYESISTLVKNEEDPNTFHDYNSPQYKISQLNSQSNF